MGIDIDIDEIDGIKCCCECGIFVNPYRAKKCPNNEKWEMNWICPFCGAENDLDKYDIYD